MNSQIFHGLLAAVALVCCYGPVHSFNSHRLSAADRLEWFCDRTGYPVNVRGRLAEKLLQLRELMDAHMSESEQYMTMYNQVTSQFSQRQTLNRLISDLDRTLNGLICMGRALDILCINDDDHSDHNRRSCIHQYGRKLYRHHQLLDNSQQLRSSPFFQMTYQDVLHDFFQMREAIDDADDFAGDGCRGWEYNSAMVQVFSHGFISAALSVLDDVTGACDTP